MLMVSATLQHLHTIRRITSCTNSCFFSWRHCMASNNVLHGTFLAPLHLQELLIQQEPSWEPPCVIEPLASTCLFEMHRFSRFPPRVHFNHVLHVTWLALLLQELQQLLGVGLSCTSEGIATQQGKNNAHDNCIDLHHSNCHKKTTWSPWDCIKLEPEWCKSRNDTSARPQIAVLGDI